MLRITTIALALLLATLAAGDQAQLLGALEKLFDQDFGLSARPGFLATAGYMPNMAGPSGAGWNYADASTGGGFHPPCSISPRRHVILACCGWSAPIS